MPRRTRKEYAIVSWTVEDVLEHAGAYEMPVTRNEARRLLESMEKELEETMVRAGWDVVSYALDTEQYANSRTELPRNPMSARRTTKE